MRLKKIINTIVYLFLKFCPLSSNVGSAVLALNLTDNVLYPALKEFGFGEKLFVDFSIRREGAFYLLLLGKILRQRLLVLGRVFSATPLQMAVAYTAIANGGFYKENPIFLVRL